VSAVLGRRSGVHLVDEFGLVGCPVLGHDVPVEVCLRCPRLRAQWTDTGGQVSEIRCAVTDEPAPGWPRLLGWSAPRRG
jgi:hypothetical protein